MDQPMLVEQRVKYRSSPNIAWIKYWGKYDEEYILPLNDSLGVTLDSQDLCTETTVLWTNREPRHGILLNGKEEKVTKRMMRMFGFVKEKVYERVWKGKVQGEQWEKWVFRVESVNSFPTASGMASSASGLACLAVALNGLFGNILSEGQLSELARLGSGSASRSIYGGLVRWKGVPPELLHTETKPTPETLEQLSKQCISFTAVPPQKLSFIKILILLANNKQKQTSSTVGMQTSAQTSELIQYRNGIANRRIDRILTNLSLLQQPQLTHKKRVSLYNDLIETIIKDSNQFHAICLDTYPPIFYLNEFSKQIINLVDHHINPVAEWKVAYTFDAGPHAFLFVHQEMEARVLGFLQGVFGGVEEGFNCRAWGILKEKREKREKGEEKEEEKGEFKKYTGPVIKPYQIWSTSIGGGTQKIA